MMVPYGVVTARNLAATHGRQVARAEALPPRLVDRSAPEQPDEVVLREEERAAIVAALGRLPDDERMALVARDVLDERVTASGEPGPSPVTARVRLARTRAKLRVEYLLQVRGVQLPTPQCRPTLLVLAGGDRQRQASTTTGAHLMSCETCASLSEPLVERRRGLLVLVPLLALRRVLYAAKAHPVISAGTAAVAAAGVVVGVGLASPGSHPAATSAAPAAASAATTAPSVPATTPPPPALTVDGHGIPGGSGSLTGLIGHPVVARGAMVVALGTHNGFWVSSGGADRLWVELTGPLRPLQVAVGNRVSFTAPLVAHNPAYAASMGVTAAEGADVLTAQGAHVDVDTAGIAVAP